LRPPHAAPDNPRRDRRILFLAGLAGAALTVIGVRFFLAPEAAARFFGFIGKPNGFQLHAVIALRDIWLGVLAVAMVMLGHWRLLTLWLGAGALVCFGDAGIVAGSNGRVAGILFHLLAGIVMTALAILAWRRAERDRMR
jgi:hypothetical protein